ncbi:MAG: hypothetical protein WCH39_03865 [Schlesneria sp.]
MARVYVELSDFAPLVHEVANRRRPLLTKTMSHGPQPLQVHLDVTLHALESIESDGPITVESAVQPGEAWIKFKADVPRINLKIKTTLTRGTFLIKDGDWLLDVNFECSVTGQIHLTGGPHDEPTTNSSQRHFQVEFKNFQVRCPAFPQWMERPMQPILERMLESIIGEMIPVELRRPFTSSDCETPETQVAALVQQSRSRSDGKRPFQRGAVNWSAYYLGYGLTVPVVWISTAFRRNTKVDSALIRPRTEPVG